MAHVTHTPSTWSLRKVMTANVMPVFLAAGTALFVVAYPQPEDFAQSLSARAKYGASEPLTRLQADTRNEPMLEILRGRPEGPALDRLYDSGCIQDVGRATPNRLAECGVLIADAIAHTQSLGRMRRPDRRRHCPDRSLPMRSRSP